MPGKRLAIVSAALLSIWAFIAVMAACGGFSSADASPSAASTTATAPAEYPSRELVDACRKVAGDLSASLGSKLVVATNPPFVTAGFMEKSELEGYVSGSIIRPANALWRSYFDKSKPDKPITILLFSGEKEYRDMAKKLFGDEDVAFYGYYKPDKRTLVMNIGTGTGTLVHELTHALVPYDFPGIPTWFNEGLASLHEQSSVGQSEIVGLVNWRLPALQKAAKDGSLRPLRELVSKNDFYGSQSGLNYAQARYFCMYMQHKGLLRKFYSYFRENSSGGDSAIKAIERIFGKKLDEAEKDCMAWVMTLKFGR